MGPGLCVGPGWLSPQNGPKRRRDPPGGPAILAAWLLPEAFAVVGLGGPRGPGTTSAARWPRVTAQMGAGPGAVSRSSLAKAGTG